MNYDSIEIKNNKATASLKENHEVVFEAIAPEVSKLFNLEHTITLHNKNGTWMIYKDEYHDELSPQLDHMTKAQIKELVDKSYQEDQKRKSSSFNSGSKVFARLLPRMLSLVNKTYNRTAAKNYADLYASGTNSYYGRQGATDCASFVSQAIYKGMGFDAPNQSGMGPSGDASQWYFDFNTKSGTGPWVGVPQQYSFITGNTSKKGPYGQVNSLCATQVGDIIQLYNASVPPDNIWDHEAIVVTSPYPYCGSLSTYLIDAHTTDRYHYPLSNWASYYPTNLWC